MKEDQIVVSFSMFICMKTGDFVGGAVPSGPIRQVEAFTIPVFDLVVLFGTCWESLSSVGSAQPNTVDHPTGNTASQTAIKE
jgi:hypothetical protein